MDDNLKYVPTKICTIAEESQWVNLLEIGDIVEEGDLYLSTSGVWGPVPISGHKIMDNGVQWARPFEPMSSQDEEE